MDASRIDITTKVREAETYLSMGLLEESLMAYEQLRSASSILGKPAQQAIKNKIMEIENEIHLLEQNQDCSVSPEDIAFFKKTLSITDEISDAIGIAAAFLELGLFEEALCEYEKLFWEDSEWKDILPNMITCLLKCCPSDETLDRLMKIIDGKRFENTEKAQIEFLIGQEFEKRNLKAPATEFYNSAYCLDPKNNVIRRKLESISPDILVNSKYDKTTSKNKVMGRGEPLRKKILRAVRDLPATPKVVLKALEMMKNINADFDEFESVLETDQAIVAKILKMANSAYYGQSRKVSSIKRAALVLGIKTIGELVIMASSSSLLNKPLKGYNLEAGDLWRHSLATALASRIIANRKKSELADSAYIAGLMHDSGKLILDPYIREKKNVFMKYIEIDGKSLSKAENMLFGFDHAEIASLVCERWNFPQPIYNAIRFHHSPSETANKELACIIYVADELAKLYGKDTEAAIIEIDDAAKKILDIEDNEIEWFMDEMIESVEQITKGIEVK